MYTLGFVSFHHVITKSTSQCLLVCEGEHMNKWCHACPEVLPSRSSEVLPFHSSSGEKKPFDRNKDSSPCNYIWSCLHKSLPQSPSRSLQFGCSDRLELPPNPRSWCFFSPFLLFQRREKKWMNWRGRIRHPVSFIWFGEISVRCASLRERTLTMPGRERWVWGRGGGECLPESAELSLT